MLAFLNLFKKAGFTFPRIKGGRAGGATNRKQVTDHPPALARAVMCSRSHGLGRPLITCFLLVL